MSEPAFGAPWQARAFAMVRAMQESGVFTAREWADALGAEIAAAAGQPDDGTAYYEHWLAALERLVVTKRLASRDSLTRYRAAWALAADRTPHGQPIRLDQEDRGGGSVTSNMQET